MKYLLILSLFVPAISFAQSCTDNKGPNIVYFTMDGIRAREFFKGTDPLLHKKVPKANRGLIYKKFWSEIAPQGIVYGGLGPFGNHYKVASHIAVSLPSYQSMLAGHATDCMNNGCGQIKVETAFERIQKELNLKKGEVALFSSWLNVAHALEKEKGTVFANSGLSYLEDGLEDPVLKKLSDEGKADPAPWNSRKDKYTFEMGLHYLKKNCPRVLYISLVDSDEWAHDKKYSEYVHSMKTYDDYLVKLVETIKGMGEYGKNTTLFVSTDHSRGIGPLWFTHGVTKVTEKNIFLFVMGPNVEAMGQINDGKKRSHAYLRGTWESLMGLNPRPQANGKIKVLKEVLAKKDEEPKESNVTEAASEEEEPKEDGDEN